jgi:hypothetical protein
MKKLFYLMLLLLQACDSRENKLYAFREAPVGGEYFKLVNDTLFEYGLSRSSHFSTGNYSLRGDTLFLTYKTRFRDSLPNGFVQRHERLEAIGGVQLPFEIISGSTK